MLSFREVREGFSKEVILDLNLRSCFILEKEGKYRGPGREFPG